MLLIELSLLGERVISLRPNSKKSFVGETYGLDDRGARTNLHFVWL